MTRRDIKSIKTLRRGGKNTHKNCVFLNDPDNHNGVVTHLESDTMECEVKLALGSITTNKAVYPHHVYFIYMQSTSCKMMGWMNHKLESRLPEEISTSDTQIIPLQWQKVKRN